MTVTFCVNKQQTREIRAPHPLPTQPFNGYLGMSGILMKGCAHVICVGIYKGEDLCIHEDYSLTGRG